MRRVFPADERAELSWKVKETMSSAAEGLWTIPWFRWMVSEGGFEMEENFYKMKDKSQVGLYNLLLRAV